MADDATVMTDLEVTASLAALWSGSGWRRLEISQFDGRNGGYCVSAAGSLQTTDALRDPACPDVVARLAALIDAAGWQRLEIVGNPRAGRAGGRRQRADGSWTQLRYFCEPHHAPGSGSRAS